MTITLQNKDRLLIPVQNGWVSKGYGVRNSDGSIHKGIDFGWIDGQQENCPVTSVQDGQVCAIFNDSVKGNCVMVKHDYEDGTWRYVMYIHLKSVSCKLFTEIKQGDELGIRGNTGSASRGTHLHIYVGKAGKDGLDMSQNVRTANFNKFLTMCDFNFMNLFYKKKGINYVGARSGSMYDSMKYIDDFDCEDCELLQKQLDDLQGKYDELDYSYKTIVDKYSILESNSKALEADNKALEASLGQVNVALNEKEKQLENAKNEAKKYSEKIANAVKALNG